MNGNQIKERIIANNKIIEEEGKATFVLNKKVLKALEENKKLREICIHDFDELGYCKYCDTKVD